jgi:hypothetical protein
VRVIGETMSTVRKLGSIAMVVLAITVAACTSSTASPPTSTTTSTRPPPTSLPPTSKFVPAMGVVTGLAEPCTGPPTDLPSHVKVQLHSGLTLVASQTVRSGARYRFSVVRGSYRLTGWWGSEDVTVRVGHTVTANFLDTCD